MREQVRLELVSKVSRLVGWGGRIHELGSRSELGSGVSQLAVKPPPVLDSLLDLHDMTCLPVRADLHIDGSVVQ